MKNRVRCLTICLLLCLFSSLLPTSALFYDVNPATNEGRAVYALYDHGIIQGYGNGFFGPEDTLTRAQAVTMINKVFHYTYPADVTFQDVTADAWYYNEVACAISAGYIQGYGNGTFGPNDTLTKEQVCVMLDNIMHFARLPINVTVSDPISPWAQDCIQRLLANHLSETDEQGRFFATKPISREKTCLLLSPYVMDHLPDIQRFDLKSVARTELESRLSRIITALHQTLIPSCDDEAIASFLSAIADNMAYYRADPAFDYKTASKATNALYRAMEPSVRAKAKQLLTDFFLDENYTDDLSILYEFFF